MSFCIDLICDTYLTPSIKDAEHAHRSDNEAVFTITGPKQKRPKDWQKALRSSSFKTAFFRFLVDEWCHNSYGEVLKGQDVCIGLAEECYSYIVLNEVVYRHDECSLICNHEEADTRIIFHLNHIITASPQDIVSVRSNDTDVLVLLLYHVWCISKVSGMPRVWMDVGLSSTNTRRYINIGEIVEHLDATALFFWACMPSLALILHHHS